MIFPFIINQSLETGRANDLCHSLDIYASITRSSGPRVGRCQRHPWARPMASHWGAGPHDLRLSDINEEIGFGRDGVSDVR